MSAAPWIKTSTTVLSCLLLIAVTACGETRQRAWGTPKVSVTSAEARMIDQTNAAASTLGNDTHRRCVLWTKVLESAGVEQHGLRSYAEETKSVHCVQKAEEDLARAERAVRAADAADTSPEAQLAAVTAVNDYFATWHVQTEKNATAEALIASVEPARQRVLSSDATCEEKRVASWLLWNSGRRDHAFAMFKGPIRSCNGPREAVAILSMAKQKGTCDDDLPLVAESWTRAKRQDDQIAILDGVRECSTPFTLRRNFSFVPRAVLVDYDAVLRNREVDRSRRDAADARRDRQDRCEADCMTMYSDKGVCLSSCHGESSCVRSCQSLGEACFRNCR